MTDHKCSDCSAYCLAVISTVSVLMSLLIWLFSSPSGVGEGAYCNYYYNQSKYIQEDRRSKIQIYVIHSNNLCYQTIMTYPGVDYIPYPDEKAYKEVVKESRILFECYTKTKPFEYTPKHFAYCEFDKVMPISETEFEDLKFDEENYISSANFPNIILKSPWGILVAISFVLLLISCCWTSANEKRIARERRERETRRELEDSEDSEDLESAPTPVIPEYNRVLAGNLPV